MEVQKQWVKENGKWMEKAIVKERPALPSRTSTQSSQGPKLPPRTSTSNGACHGAQLPIRQAAKSPALPVRRPSEISSIDSRRPSDVALNRRGSDESMSSIATAETSLSNGTSVGSRSDRFTIRAPEYDPNSLPKLPPRKTKEEKEAEAKAARRPYKSTNSTSTVPRTTEPVRPQPPPRPQTRPPPSQSNRGNLPEGPPPPEPEPAVVVPSRAQPPLPPMKRPVTINGFGHSQQQQEQPQPVVPNGLHRVTEPEPEAPALPRRTLPPPAKRSALSLGFGGGNQQAPSAPTNRPGSVPVSNGNPPPIPTASRPDLAALQASKPKLNGASASPSVATAGGCLHCRDFSGPDNHAARFSRESIPSTDLSWLANQLTSPFPSATDKARAIFTWQHHNIAYDVDAFFGNRVQPSTPQKTFSTGLAVCEGYAALFVALAVKVGLEAVVVGGNGKGFGYTPLNPGEPVPPYSSGHAWNAVKIDGGEWKLIDPCWGAGAVGGAGQPYSKRFAPENFTASNVDFGRSHFPEDSSKQYRNDGRTISWEEYITGNKSGTAAQMFSGYTSEEGVSTYSFSPVANPIVLAQQGPTVRFSFQTVCPHWDPVRCGKGAYYVYVLHMEGLDGTDRNHVPFQKGDGIWWCDVPVRDLGRAGQKATICSVSEFKGKDGRGVTVDEYRRSKGKVMMMFGFVAQWKLA